MARWLMFASQQWTHQIASMWYERITAKGRYYTYLYNIAKWDSGSHFSMSQIIAQWGHITARRVKDGARYLLPYPFIPGCCRMALLRILVQNRRLWLWNDSPLQQGFQFSVGGLNEDHIRLEMTNNKYRFWHLLSHHNIKSKWLR